MIAKRDANRLTTDSNIIEAASGTDHLSDATFGISASFSTIPSDTP